MKKQKIEITQGCILKKVNQDYCVSTDNLAVVLDGCGSGEHSEIGAQRMGEAIRKNSKEITSGRKLLSTIVKVFRDIFREGVNAKEFRDKYLFTLLVCIEKDENFEVHNAGDGYIITIDNNKNVKYIKINNNIMVEGGNAPRYIAYDFIGGGMYKECAFLDIRFFPKSDYQSVYVATDGLRFILSDRFPKQERKAFEKALIDRDEQSIREILKRNSKMIYDDIAIAL